MAHWRYYGDNTGALVDMAYAKHAAHLLHRVTHNHQPEVREAAAIRIKEAQMARNTCPRWILAQHGVSTPVGTGIWAQLQLLFFFFFFCNTSPKPQLQCSQEASPIYIESPTSPSQGSAGRQAGVTAAAGRCKVVNYATKWTSQKWSPHTPRPGAVADNLGVLSGRVPVLSGYPIIRGKHWYIGRETRGSSGGGGVGSGRPGRGGSPTGERRKWHSTRMV